MELSNVLLADSWAKIPDVGFAKVLMSSSNISPLAYTLLEGFVRDSHLMQVKQKYCS